MGTPLLPCSNQTLPPLLCNMAPMKAMSKGAIAAQLAETYELKKSVAAKIIDDLAEIGTKEVTTTGKFTIPGLVMIKTRKKPATKACKKEMFGKMCTIKAKPAKTVVKAFAVAALKKSV